MKTILFVIITIAMIAVTTLIFVACGQVDIEVPVSFMVEDEVYASVVVGSDQSVSLPDNPQVDGKNFNGWFLDPGIWAQHFTLNSLLNIPLKKETSLTVYAYMDAPEKAIGGSDPDEDYTFKRDYVIPRDGTENPVFGFYSNYYDYDGYAITSVFLGTVINTCLDRLSYPVSYNPNNGPLTKTVTRTSSTQSEIEQIVNRSVSESTTITDVRNWKIGENVTIGWDKFPAKAGITAEYGQTNTTSNSYSTSLSQSYARASKVSSTISNTLTIDFTPETHQPGSYRWCLVGTLEVYGFYVYDLKTNQAYYATRAFIVNEKEQLQYDRNGLFKSETKEHLVFDEEVFKKLASDQQALDSRYRHLIRFDLAGGYDCLTSMEYIYDGNEHALPIPKKDGCVFIGWHERNGRYHQTLNSTDNQDLNLVAHYISSVAVSWNNTFISDHYSTQKCGTKDVRGRAATFTETLSVPESMVFAVKDGLIGINVEASFETKVRSDGATAYAKAYLTINGKDTEVCCASAKGKKVLWETFLGDWKSASGATTQQTVLNDTSYTIGAIYYVDTESGKTNVFKNISGKCTALRITYYNVK